MIEEIKKNYKIINIVIFCLCIYFFSFSIISDILKKISPQLGICPFFTLTGIPCPLCGGTRFIIGIKSIFSDFSYVLNFFGAIVFTTLLELIFRVMNILKKTYSYKLIYIDIIIHFVIFVLYTFYEIYYIIKI